MPARRTPHHLQPVCWARYSRHAGRYVVINQNRGRRTRRATRQTAAVDVRQALLDARVAEAAEAWLADPRDVALYARLVAAVERRRRHPSGSERDERAVRDLVAGTFDPPVMPSAAAEGDGTVVRHAEEADFEHLDGADLEPSDADLGLSDEPLHRPVPPGARPAVRAVGADLVGDPAAVLRRLRGG